MVAAGVLALALGSVFALNSQVTAHVRRGVTGSYASQLIQERIEQFRRAAWTDLTSNYPPVSDDPSDSGYDSDPDETDGTVYLDDSYPPGEFPYDLSDLDASNPGLDDLLAITPASAAQLPNLVETITVETYNASSVTGKAYTGDVDSNGEPVTVDVAPQHTGGNPITVHKSNGTVTVDNFNPLLVLSTTIRLKINVQWRGSDGVTRTKEFLTLFTVEGDK